MSCDGFDQNTLNTENSHFLPMSWFEQKEVQQNILYSFWCHQVLYLMKSSRGKYSVTNPNVIWLSCVWPNEVQQATQPRISSFFCRYALDIKLVVQSHKMLPWQHTLYLSLNFVRNVCGLIVAYVRSILNFNASCWICIFFWLYEITLRFCIFRLIFLLIKIIFAAVLSGLIVKRKCLEKFWGILLSV